MHPNPSSSKSPRIRNYNFFTLPWRRNIGKTPEFKELKQLSNGIQGESDAQAASWTLFNVNSDPPACLSLSVVSIFGDTPALRSGAGALSAAAGLFTCRIRTPPALGGRLRHPCNPQERRLLIGLRYDEIQPELFIRYPLHYCAILLQGRVQYIAFAVFPLSVPVPASSSPEIRP